MLITIITIGDLQSGNFLQFSGYMIKGTIIALKFVFIIILSSQKLLGQIKTLEECSFNGYQQGCDFSADLKFNMANISSHCAWLQRMFKKFQDSPRTNQSITSLSPEFWTHPKCPIRILYIGYSVLNDCFLGGKSTKIIVECFIIGRPGKARHWICSNSTYYHLPILIIPILNIRIHHKYIRFLWRNYNIHQSLTQSYLSWHSINNLCQCLI